MKEEIKDVIKKDKRFFGEEKMKLPIKIVEEMVEKYPNDMELGSRVRWYINWLKAKTKSIMIRTKHGDHKEKKEETYHHVFTSDSNQKDYKV